MLSFTIGKLPTTALANDSYEIDRASVGMTVRVIAAAHPRWVGSDAGSVLTSQLSEGRTPDYVGEVLLGDVAVKTTSPSSDAENGTAAN